MIAARRVLAGALAAGAFAGPGDLDSVFQGNELATLGQRYRFIELAATPAPKLTGFLRDKLEIGAPGSAPGSLDGCESTADLAERLLSERWTCKRRWTRCGPLCWRRPATRQRLSGSQRGLGRPRSVAPGRPISGRGPSRGRGRLLNHSPKKSPLVRPRWDPKIRRCRFGSGPPGRAAVPWAGRLLIFFSE
jgi:hypothetical protein